MSRQKPVKVAVRSFDALLGSGQAQLALDTYQRPYVWGEDKVRQLLSDLREFNETASSDPVYYMGAILVHEDSSRHLRYIIDGQQRLTTLCILYHSLNDKLPDGLDFSFRSPESSFNIKRTQRIIAAEAISRDWRAIFRKIHFTVITVQNEDLAFTFFDNQNSRGVQLGAPDLLKAFHLRAIDGDARERLQSEFARRWEHWQSVGSCQGLAGDFANILFGKLLWRGRRWRGQKTLATETRQSIIDEFQGKRMRRLSKGEIAVFPGPEAWSRTRLHVAADGRVSLTQAGSTQPATSAELPFSIRQPVHQGIGFFLYIERYASLVDELLNPAHVAGQIHEFRNFYARVTMSLSEYLREFICLATIMYVDRFGTADLMRFTLWLDYVIGAIRIEKSYVFSAAPTVYLRESSMNLLDVIAHAYSSDEVIEFLRADPAPRNIYAEEAVEAGNGVKGRYKKALLEYFNRDGSLAGREAWIMEIYP